jgi:two-component system, NtrC family, sensor histidine kinase HydH
LKAQTVTHKLELRKLSLIRPKNIISIAVVMALIMIASAIFELSQSKKELDKLLNDEANSTIQNISVSSSNAVMSNDEVENLIAQRLLTTARLVKRLDSMKALSNQVLNNIAMESSVYRINIFNHEGLKIFSNQIFDSIHTKETMKYSPMDFIEPVLKGEKNEIIIGLKEARHEEGKRFAVAVKRSDFLKGAIVINVEASYLLEFKKKIGFSKMIGEIGNNTNIEYIVLQNEKGIINKNKDVKNLKEISDDSFLKTAYNSDSVFTRVLNLGEDEFFETVKTFYVNREKLGLLRIGLKMDEMKSLETRMLRRGIILSVVLFIIGVIVLSIVVTNQNLKFISGEYEKIQTYSGNILQNMADAVITTDVNGTISLFNNNAENLFDIKKESVIGKNIFDVLNNRFDFLKSSLTGKVTLFKKEVFYETNESQRKILQLTTTFTKNSSGDYDSFTAVISDLTGIKNMERQIKQKEKFTAMGELAAGVAHEIRNPLNAISMIAQRYKKEFQPITNEKEYSVLTGVLLSETKRMNVIIEQFLKFAKPPKLNLQNISSHLLIYDIKSLIETSCKSRSITLNVIERSIQDIYVDKELIKQAILNLMLNAIDACPVNGNIDFEFSLVNNDIIRFIVRDNGPGIEPDKLDKIFNLYYTTKTSGTGLGLSIVEQIIAQHNGNIKVNSTPGTGAEFIIDIPITKSF